jgi:DtxR family Mn-dependent transcriptional regulator
MKMDEKTPVPLSESVQMYLVTIARLRVDSRPVPLSQLAQSLSISPVSVNEMCRKLQDQGLLIYQPYKGASLTPEGEQRAFYILRRHRLWEVFLVEKLGFAYDQAHDAACQLEHTTPDLVADRLDIFLGHPAVNPEGEPIPGSDGKLPARFLYPLTAFSAGQRGHVVRCDVSEAAQTFLDEQGVRPGASVTVMATAEDSLLVQVGEVHISLAWAVAEAVQVEPEQKGEAAPLESTTEKEESKMEPRIEATATQIPLHELGVGQRGVVVHVGGKGPARRRMMDMGLVPGTEVKVVRVAPLGDPVEFELKGYSLSLRKSEARDITVEVPAEETG